jgi:hypothetical protein
LPAAEEYLQRAAECVRLARATDDAAKKARLLEMAEAWRSLIAKIQNDKPGNVSTR